MRLASKSSAQRPGAFARVGDVRVGRHDRFLRASRARRRSRVDRHRHRVRDVRHRRRLDARPGDLLRDQRHDDRLARPLLHDDPGRRERGRGDAAPELRRVPARRHLRDLRPHLQHGPGRELEPGLRDGQWRHHGQRASRRSSPGSPPIAPTSTSTPPPSPAARSALASIRCRSPAPSRCLASASWRSQRPAAVGGSFLTDARRGSLAARVAHVSENIAMRSLRCLAASAALALGFCRRTRLGSRVRVLRAVPARGRARGHRQRHRRP